MNRLQGKKILGLRDMETNKVIAVYPEKIEGTDSEIEEKVKFWYYQQGCSAEEELKSSFVDNLTPEEAESVSKNKNS